MDKFKTVLDFANKQTNLGFGFVALLTAGGEQIFSSTVFNCPCNNWNFLYGMVFLLVPALALLVIGYILSKKTWKLFTGICFRKTKLCRWKTMLAGGMVFFQLSTTTLIAPASWIAVALLNGKYFQCALTGVNVTAFQSYLCADNTWSSQCQLELYRFPCSTAPSADKDDVLRTLRAVSQILGWLLIATVMVFNLLLTCAARCNSPISYLQLQFWRAYSQQENSLLEGLSAKHAKELAERNLKSFFQMEPPADIKTPSNQDWLRASSFFRFSTRDHYYSTMHQYVERGAHEHDGFAMTSVRSQGPDIHNPAVLAFLDEGKVML